MSYFPPDNWHLKVVAEPVDTHLGSAYDQALVWRREAKDKKDYVLADKLRTAAEWEYGLTIVDSPEEFSEGGHDFQYYQRMRAVVWLKKYAKFVISVVPGEEPKPVDDLIEAINDQESFTSRVVGHLVPRYI